MATSYPTSVDNFTNPSSSNTLDSPSHSDQHANANDAIEATQTELDRVKRLGIIRVERATSAQTISNNSLTTVVLNSIIREDDTGGDFTMNTGTGILTINATGWYDISAGVVWTSNSTGERLTRILVDSTTAIVWNVKAAHLSSGDSVTTKKYLTAGQTLLLQVRQVSTANLDLLATDATFMAVSRIR